MSEEREERREKIEVEKRKIREEKMLKEICQAITVSKSGWENGNEEKKDIFRHNVIELEVIKHLR